MQSVYELNLILHNNSTCLNNQCCLLQSSLLGTLNCATLTLALFEPFCTAHHLNWASVWWLCLNLGEISKSPVPSWIAGKTQLSTKKNRDMFFTYEPMCLAFFGCGYGGLLHWFLGHTIKLTSYHMLLLLWWEIWGSFRQLSKVLAHVNLIFLLLLIQQVVDMDLVVIWHMDRLSVRVFWADPNEIPNILVIWWIVILLVWAQSLSLGPHFHLPCLLMNVLSVQHLQQRSYHYWTWNTTQNLVFFPSFALQQLL